MPTPQRLPIVNSDDGVWGDILRQYLLKEHYDDGTDNAVNGGHKTITIRPGTAAAGTAPLKFTSGTLLTAPEAGAIEFNSDKLYFTKTTGPTRQTVATYDTTGSTGDIYYRDSSSNFVRLGIGSTNDVLTVSGGLPTWQPGGSALPVTDNTAIVKGTADNTKQLKLDVSGLATATTRTLTVPDANTTIVGTDTTQTLTNKTISGTSNTITGVTGMLAPVQGMVNTETLTISGGSVTQIAGTTVNGYTPAIGDRILIADAPASSGAAPGYTMTSQPANGIYIVTGNTTNLTVSRTSDMSGSVKPGGMAVLVENASWPASQTLFYVDTPNDLSAFTWGTTSLKFTYDGGPSGQRQQVWVSNNGLGYNIYNGTGWTKFVGTTNAGTQTLTLPATATSDTIVGRASTDTLTNKTLTDAKFNAIKDTNGNNAITISATASAVNSVTVNNAAASSNPSIAASGSDTNIGINLQTKGTGVLYVLRTNGHSTVQAGGAYNSGNVNLELNSQGTGVVRANGVQVADISSTQTLTNKNNQRGQQYHY